MTACRQPAEVYDTSLFGGIKSGARREEPFIVAILKFCLFIKSWQLCIEVLAGVLIASDTLCHLKVGLMLCVVVFFSVV